jgi:branched-chain amino acid transport system substrate-binding protein
MHRRTGLVLVAAILALIELALAELALAGCGSAVAVAPTVTVNRCAAKIAFFGPLSGSAADLGEYIHSGMVLAVERYNSAHPDCTVHLADFDSQGDPKQAPALAQQVVSDGAIIGVVGPAFSGESEAADPLLNQGGVASITSSATEAALSERGWATFHRIIANDAVQGPAAGRYIADTLGARKVFVIDDTEAYGHGLAAEVISVLGSRVVQSAQVPSGQSDLTGLVSQIRAAAPDVIFFGGYYLEAGLLLRQMRSAGVTATFVSGDAVKDDEFLLDAGKVAAEGAIITCPCAPPESATGGFAEAYRKRFGRPAGTYSTEAYDAANIFLDGILAGRLTRPGMVSFVSAYAGSGVNGDIRFGPTGELISSHSVWAYQVRDGVIVPMQPIPTG